MSEIKATTDYELFGMIDGNREVDNTHVRRLVRVLRENNLTEKFPIVVNQNMEVIDGQHRLEALRRLELPVYYRVEDNVPIDDIRILNQVSKRWSWLDLARSYIDLGNENYQPILDLYEQRTGLFNLDTLLSIAGVGSARSNTKPLSNHFFGGGLVLDDEQRAQLIKMTSQLADFADAQPHFKSYVGQSGLDIPRSYSRALVRIMKNEAYDHQTFIQKLATSHLELPMVVDANEALREVEKAYNRNQGEDSRVRLF